MHSMVRFKDKIIVIFGASSGIGEETAYRFAKENALLILLARREDKSIEVLEKCKALGANEKSIFIQTDVSKISDINTTFQQISEQFGYIDYAFNNAGIEEKHTSIHEKTEEDYDIIMNTNVKGLFFSMQHEIELMRKKGKGSIVNTASISGFIGQIGLPIYNGSKHAILGMTKSLGIEVAKEGIRINAVSPGSIATELYYRCVNKEGSEIDKQSISMHPIKRIGTCAEVAGAVLWLCSDESTFIIGQSITIDGGYTAQ